MRGHVASFAACALVAVSVPWSSAEAAPITLTSTVAENGINSTIGNGPLSFTASPGYDFTAQNYSSLSSITELVVTLTLFDADSAVGNLDHNKLTLGLDGIDTGIQLNGFRDGFTDTLTIAGVPSPTVVASLLDAVRTGWAARREHLLDRSSEFQRSASARDLQHHAVHHRRRRELERVARQPRPIRPARIDTLL